MKAQLQASQLKNMLLDNRYLIGQKLNKGGYGTVYYAQDLNGYRFAIKAIKLQIKNKQNINKDKILQNIKKQHQKMLFCQSDYIMKCYQTLDDQQNKLRFIVMELCQFSSLEDLIYLKGHLQEGQAKNILKHILCGLQQLHRKGLCHRDIKTSNVCFKQNRCVLCDFGCSKQFLNKQQIPSWRNSIRKQGTVLGTIISKSPEMLQNKQYGLKTDIWAVGILFYQCLTGVPPFLFNMDLSDPQALLFIQQNINKIYDKQYIRQNLKKHQMQVRGNCILSQKAKRFLKKLIVFDQNQRISLTKLQKQQYLLEQQKQSNWQKANCVIPLRQINWKLHIQQIRQRCKNNNTYKQQTIRKYQVKKIQTPLKKLEAPIRKKLSIGLNQVLQKQRQTYNKIKIIHFEIRRLNLLKDFRGYLQQQIFRKKNIKCMNLGLLISMYCFIKLKQLKQKIDKTGLESLKNNFDIQQLWNLIQGIYISDKNQINPTVMNWSKIVFKKCKQFFIYSSEKKQFYQEIRNQNIETVYKYISKQIQKVYQQIKKKSKGQQIKFVQFFQNAQKILQISYEPSNKDDLWKNWKDFQEIILYLSSKKNYITG